MNYNTIGHILQNMQIPEIEFKLIIRNVDIIIHIPDADWHPLLLLLTIHQTKHLNLMHPIHILTHIRRSRVHFQVAIKWAHIMDLQDVYLLPFGGSVGCDPIGIRQCLGCIAYEEKE